MANHYSALKRAKQTEKRTLVNRMRKSRLRHQVRAIRQKLEENDAAGAQELLPKTFSLIDRAAKWGIIKANTASRYKSRMHSRIKKIAAA
jgi:small subunit ribosomal protein S20